MRTSYIEGMRMVKSRLKRKVFVTPEKPGVVEKTCWVEDEKQKEPNSKAKAKRRKA